MKSVSVMFLTAACCAALISGCTKKELRKDVGAIKEAQVRAEDLKVVKLSGKLSVNMVRITPGKFNMSAPDGDNFANETAHNKELKNEFYIGQTEVTQAEYNEVVRQWKEKFPEKWAELYPEKWNPADADKKFGEDVKPAKPFFCKDGAFKKLVENIATDNFPVENISWFDAMDFCMMLNDLNLAPEGWKFTLPTETQWEFAARGGNIGKSRNFKFSGSNDVDNVAWHYPNAGGRPKAVGITDPGAKRSCNALGLYDMSGNIAEWCLDSWKDYSQETAAEFSDNYQQMRDRFHELVRVEIENLLAKENKRAPRVEMTPELKAELDAFDAWKVYRGGSWNGAYNVCRVSNRSAVKPYKLVRSLKEEKGKKSIVTYTVSGYPHVGFRLVLVPDAVEK